METNLAKMLWRALSIYFMLFISSYVFSEDIVFRHILVDENGPTDCWGKSIGDLDGDQKIDLITGGYKTGGLVWYKNPSWKKQTIASSGQWRTDHEAVDVDQDGDVDVVSLCIDSLCWYENPSWAKHIIDHLELHDIEIADFDGDGDCDLVVRAKDGLATAGRSYTSIDRKVLNNGRIELLNAPMAKGLATGDIDRDNDIDIVLNLGVDRKHGGYRDRLLAAAQVYKTLELSRHVCRYSDINQDGRLDIILTPAERAGQHYRISWFEAPNDLTVDSWSEHVIDHHVEAVQHFVGAADMDLDGKCRRDHGGNGARRRSR